MPWVNHHLPSYLYCRSELAREELKDNACIQDERVIVNDHREQARSYRVGASYVGISAAESC
ncbi:hypothetical protein D3C81_2274560 [compost metagenome]